MSNHKPLKILFIKRNRKDSHLVIKMDIEGAEAKILKSSVEIFKKYKSVSILIEVHPHEYDGDEMYFALQNCLILALKLLLSRPLGWGPQNYRGIFGTPI